nr:putative neural-cadherin 2 [Penaeus vannamei]
MFPYSRTPVQKYVSNENTYRKYGEFRVPVITPDPPYIPTRPQSSAENKAKANKQGKYPPNPDNTLQNKVATTLAPPLAPRHSRSSREARAAQGRFSGGRDRHLGSNGGGCEDKENSRRNQEGKRQAGVGGRRVHVVESVLTVLVKDINDNPPVFPNATMFGEVQENGPIDLSVCVVSAWDPDDVSEGMNAKFTYSIEKNVLHERSGEAIFAIHAETGLVRTALCCLDRESTPEYRIQVVATDGGALKGTGTVVVRLTDVNDNSPRLTRQLWQVEVNETWGSGPQSNATLLEITADDPDTANYFLYRIVEKSGWGWEHFAIRTKGSVGYLYARRHSISKMLLIRKGSSLWSKLPIKLQITAYTNEGKQQVEYRLEDNFGALNVDAKGNLGLSSPLDRENFDGGKAVVKVIGVDQGLPHPLSSTATVTISINDENDCPPHVVDTVFHVTEERQSTLLGVLKAFDQDDWELGHGPPFSFALASSNPPEVLNLFNIKFDADLDSGRGGAELWTTGPIDREVRKQLQVVVRVTDAQGLADTTNITVVVDDINDNPMSPATKSVYLWRPEGGTTDIPLGRVYVDDRDDCDLNDKTFQWVTSPHPHFNLNHHSGEIFASSQVREGRYTLRFSVTDTLWGSVSTNVSVYVRILTEESIRHAKPLLLNPITATALIEGWKPDSGGGVLGKLVHSVSKIVGEFTHTVDIVSVSDYRQQIRLNSHTTVGDTTDKVKGFSVSSQINHHRHHHPSPSPSPTSCVWISVRENSGRFVDPVKLHGLIGLQIWRVSEITKLRVIMDEFENVEESWRAENSSILPVSHNDLGESSSVASLASTALPLQVVDINSTSLVTPRLTRNNNCNIYEPEYCTSSSTCLNGGICPKAPTPNRCICPGESWGSRCKILARTFFGRGWTWVRPLPSCLPTTISLRILTRQQEGLVLYSGPLSSKPQTPDTSSTIMVMQVWQGRPQLLLQGRGGPLKVELNTTISNGYWHTIRIHIRSKGVMLILDPCTRNVQNSGQEDTRCLARGTWKNRSAQAVRPSLGHGILQLGGRASTPLRLADHGWTVEPTSRSLDGCISHLRINGQLVDLGEPAHSEGSESGCRSQERACRRVMTTCREHGRCEGGVEQPECECDPGRSGFGCQVATVPTTLRTSSYVRIALSFKPPPHLLTVQLRVRMQGAQAGQLVLVKTHDDANALSIHLRAGVACASLSYGGRISREACVNSRPLDDGSWHLVRAECQSYSLAVSVDDGDGWRRNDSVPDFEREGVLAPMHVGRIESVYVGGVPEFTGVGLVSVRDDLRDACIDDLRVSGRSLPLPPANNLSPWGQVTTVQNVDSGCVAADTCYNTSCPAPLTCSATWGRSICSCGPGTQYVDDACEDVDECLWNPCLHGGSCSNAKPGFLCLCGPSHSGQHCQWTNRDSAAHPYTMQLIIIALALSVIFVVVVGVVVSMRLRYSWLTRSRRKQSSDEAERQKEGINVGENEKDERSACAKPELQHQASLKCLLVRLPPEQLNVHNKEPESPPQADTPSGKPPLFLIPKDDLRAYAYEGEGSLSGSLSSATSSSQRGENGDEAPNKALVKGFLDVIDLLKNLPDATKSPIFDTSRKNNSSCLSVQEMDKQLQEMDKQPQAKENNQSVDIASVTAISHVTSECGNI